MKKILFLHGFASSGHNGTAIMLREQLYADGVTVIAPDIPVMPAEAMPFLRQLVVDEAPDLIVTASMGGLYGEQLRGIPRILIKAQMVVFDGEHSLNGAVVSAVVLPLVRRLLDLPPH